MTVQITPTTAQCCRTVNVPPVIPQHALSGNARIMPFDPKVTCKQECIITTFQDVYFVSDSFEEAKVKMR